MEVSAVLQRWSTQSEGCTGDSIRIVLACMRAGVGPRWLDAGVFWKIFFQIFIRFSPVLDEAVARKVKAKLVPDVKAVA